MNPPTPEPSPLPPGPGPEKATVPGAADQASAPATPLTPEEQMALFEKELKETDWGHQPC